MIEIQRKVYDILDRIGDSAIAELAGVLEAHTLVGIQRAAI